MSILEDLKKKIDVLSQKMDEQLNSGNFQDYQRLADTYLKLVREYESLNKPNKHPYWTNPIPFTYPWETPKNPLKWNEITCWNSDTPTCTINIDKVTLTSSETSDLAQKIQDAIKKNTTSV
jgi:hypothetical protein